MQSLLRRFVFRSRVRALREGGVALLLRCRHGKTQKHPLLNATAQALLVRSGPAATRRLRNGADSTHDAIIAAAQRSTRTLVTSCGIAAPRIRRIGTQPQPMGRHRLHRDPRRRRRAHRVRRVALLVVAGSKRAQALREPLRLDRPQLERRPPLLPEQRRSRIAHRRGRLRPPRLDRLERRRSRRHRLRNGAPGQPRLHGRRAGSRCVFRLQPGRRASSGA